MNRIAISTTVLVRGAAVGLIASVVLLSSTAVAQAADRIEIQPFPAEAPRFGMMESVVTVDAPAGNRFLDTQATLVVTAPELAAGADSKTITVSGFCDSEEGRTFRIRFMPRVLGMHSYTLRCEAPSVTGRRQEHEISGCFDVVPSPLRGPVRVDPEHPTHFLFEASNDHFFYNGTTTYWLLGWKDEQIIRDAIDRLAGLGVTRIRVALCGRTHGGERWDELLVQNSDQFEFKLSPWPAARPENVEDPGFDTARFAVDYWQKVDRTVSYAREKGLIVSLIFYLDGADKGAEPFGTEHAGGEREQLYYRYVISRLAANANVMWDVTNEYRLFRDDAWAKKMGSLVKQTDPYGHLVSIHGHGDFRFRTEPWADFAMYQSWDEHGGHDFMLRQLAEQVATGRIIPQVNEEYGYEDHYPRKWGGNKRYPSRAADKLRRTAWGIYMAGGYQSTGERADRGAGASVDSGGGWINGRGDETMTMLVGYKHIRTCFESLEYWKLKPSDGLVTDGAMCLANPGREYLVYIPNGGSTELKLDEAPYSVIEFDPVTGHETEPANAAIQAGVWTSPAVAAGHDAAFILKRQGG